MRSSRPWFIVLESGKSDLNDFPPIFQWGISPVTVGNIFFDWCAWKLRSSLLLNVFGRDSVGIQFVNEESLVVTNNLYCQTFHIVPIFIRKRNEPLPNTSRGIFSSYIPCTNTRCLREGEEGEGGGRPCRYLSSSSGFFLRFFSLSQ